MKERKNTTSISRITTKKLKSLKNANIIELYQIKSKHVFSSKYQVTYGVYTMFAKLFLFYDDSFKNKKYIAPAIVTYFLFQILELLTILFIGSWGGALLVRLLGGRDAVFVAYSILFFVPNICFLAISSGVILRLFCKKKSNVTMTAVLVCFVLTAIVHLLGYTWIFSFLENTEISGIIMNFFIPSFWLFPKYINYLGSPCSKIVFLISFAISYWVALKFIKNAFCQNCEYAKEEYSTASLLFPSYVIDALKSGTVELSSLENLKLGMGNYPLKIKIISCHHCRQSSISVYSIEKSSNGNMFENTIYKSDNVDYVWAQKLANHYESEFRKKRD